MATAIGRPQGRCQCHSVLDDCCPDRLRGVLDAGATRVGVHAMGGAPAGVAAMIDHTLLKPDATRQNIEELCREAAQFKSRRLREPDGVALCAQLLAGTGVRVVRSSSFRWRDNADVKGYETRRVIFDGRAR